jgi:hypothetical protein
LILAEINNFDTKNFRKLLLKDGLRKTWINIIFTHLSSEKKFAYILKSPEYGSAKILSKDYIKGLTIGEISVLYEYSVALINSKSRKSNGQFFTPDDVAKFMAKFSKDFGDGIWLDPCSGIGNLSWHLVNAQSDPEKFLLNNLVLSDKDELALLIARTLLTISFQKNHLKLYFDIKEKFISFDFLSVSDDGQLDLFGSKDSLQKIPMHDFVIVNPPYLAVKKDTRFETSNAGDLYSYFMENIIKTSRGFISITPQSFTNAKKFESLRKLLLNNYPNFKVFTFDNVPANVFKGIKFGSKNSNQANSIRAAITVASKSAGKQRITGLVRWRTSERALVFKHIEEFLSEVPLSDQFFPKVSADYEEVYRELIQQPALRSIARTQKTKYPLYIPSAPRYFIPALKKAAKRASQKTIYFDSDSDRDYAYMLINSSAMYWWWRVRDGGMTLSLETLMSLPLPKFRINNKIIAELEKSEKTSKVYKQNAGAAQENVKHPKTLINKLNHAVIPKYAKLLVSLHENSEFTKLIKHK